MNEAKLQSILANASAISKKVYDSVHVREPWSKITIHNDIVRRNVGARDLRMTEGCLRSLKDAGIIAESKPGFFVRKSIKSKVKTVNKSIAEKPQINTSPETNVDPIKLLSGLAEQLRDVAEAIDDAALVIGAQLDAEEQKYSKLKQLSALLKDLD